MHTFKMYYVFADQQWIRCGFKRQPHSFDDAWQQVEEDFLDIVPMADEVRREQMQLPPSPLWRIGIEELDETGKQVANQVRNITMISSEDSIRERREKLGADADLAEAFEPEIIEAFAKEHGIEPVRMSAEAQAEEQAIETELEQAAPSEKRRGYYKVTTAEGVEMRVEPIMDLNEINAWLREIFQLSKLKQMKKKLKHVQEMCFQITAGMKSEPETAQVLLFHLVYQGKSCLTIFRVHKDHVAIAEREAEKFKAMIKKEFGWDASKSGSHPMPKDYFK